MLVTRSMVKCVLFIALAISCLVGGASAALAPPFAFEDRNNNGVFDGSDADITQILLQQRFFQTAQSVVIMGGPLKPIDPRFKQTGEAGGAYIRAGRNITVLSSILCPFYSGTVMLWAGGSIQVGDMVTLQGRDYVDVTAVGDITIGDGVKMLSSGGSANFGSASVYSYKSVRVGSNFQMSTLTESRLYAGAGDIDLGPGSKLTSTRSAISLSATTGVRADGARLRGSERLSVSTLTGPISARAAYATVPRGRPIQITAYAGAVNLSGATFSVVPQVTGLSIVW